MIESDAKVHLSCRTNDPLPSGGSNESEPVNFLAPTEWSNPVEWPICLPIVGNCTELPDLGNSIVNVTALPVAVGDSLKFKCVDTGNLKHFHYVN